MKPLTLKPVQSVGGQRSFFSDKLEPTWPAHTVRQGGNLRALRMELGLTVATASKRLGVQASELALLEQGGVETDYVEAARRLRCFR